MIKYELLEKRPVYLCLWVPPPPEWKLNMFNLNVIYFIKGVSPYRAENTFHHSYKTSQLRMYKAKVTIYSDKLTEHST